MNVLHGQAGIGLIEADGCPARRYREVDEFLKMLAARRWRRIFRKLEDYIEYLSDILREVGDVFVEGAIVDGKNPIWLSSNGTNCAKCGVPTVSRSC
jgi:hypothetical protein